MGEAEDVIARAKSVAGDLYEVLQRDGVTGEEVIRAAAPFDDIEREIKRLLADG